MSNSVWLIESNGEWWCGQSGYRPSEAELYWCKDANRALQFVRQVDAERTISNLNIKRARATEHVFLKLDPLQVEIICPHLRCKNGLFEQLIAGASGLDSQQDNCPLCNGKGHLTAEIYVDKRNDQSS